MSIKRADELSFSPPPRCPVCDIGIVAFGASHPFAVDEQGRIYCRRHGATIEPSFPSLYDAFKTERLNSRYMDLARREKELPPIAGLLERIEEQYHPEQIWLFGSRARGDNRATSDWDLLVLVPDSTDEELLDIELAWKVQNGSGVYADVIPLRASEYRAAMDVANSLEYEVAREGYIIHERQTK
jgi:predicted nucleotidyltransferase